MVRKFSYSSARVGTWNTFVNKEHFKVKNSGDSYMEKMTDSKPMDMMDTVSEKSTQNSSMPNPELFETEKKVLNDQVCYRVLILALY